jgi:hypothetical protein
MRIDIETENAAFDDDMRSEIIGVLKDIIERLEAGEDPHYMSVLDTNGNRCAVVLCTGNEVKRFKL